MIFNYLILFCFINLINCNNNFIINNTIVLNINNNQNNLINCHIQNDIGKNFIFYNDYEVFKGIVHNEFHENLIIKCDNNINEVVRIDGILLFIYSMGKTYNYKLL